MGMGMFDDIRCTAELPKVGPDPGTRDFQTKDLDCALDQYFITNDGRLFKGRELIAFHGMVEFHHFDIKTRTYWSYEANFTDGRLVEIKPLRIYSHRGIHPAVTYHHYFPAGGAVQT
jgi:hypothetical protein